MARLNGQLCILVADGDRGFLGELCSLVRQHLPGSEVHSATDGRAVRRLLRRHEYDALVVQWRLPEVPGDEIVAELRSQGDQIPVIVTSANADAEARLRLVHDGADDVLGKPAEPVALVAKIEGLVRRCRLRREMVVWYGGTAVDVAHGRLVRNGRTHPLCAADTRLALALFRRRGRVATYEEMATAADGSSENGQPGTLYQRITAIRKGLRKIGSELTVKTQRRRGCFLWTRRDGLSSSPGFTNLREMTRNGDSIA